MALSLLARDEAAATRGLELCAQPVRVGLRHANHANAINILGADRRLSNTRLPSAQSRTIALLKARDGGARLAFRSRRRQLNGVAAAARRGRHSRRLGRDCARRGRRGARRCGGRRCGGRRCGAGALAGFQRRCSCDAHGRGSSCLCRNRGHSARSGRNASGRGLRRLDDRAIGPNRHSANTARFREISVAGRPSGRQH